MPNGSGIYLIDMIFTSFLRGVGFGQEPERLMIGRDCSLSNLNEGSDDGSYAPFQPLETADSDVRT